MQPQKLILDENNEDIRQAVTSSLCAMLSFASQTDLRASLCLVLCLTQLFQDVISGKAITDIYDKHKNTRKKWSQLH